MDQIILKPVLKKHHYKKYKGVMAINVKRINRITTWRCLHNLKFQPWLKWSGKQGNAAQQQQSYSWLSTLSRIWKLPFSQHMNSYDVKQVHLNAKYHNSIFINAARNKPNVVQVKQQGPLLNQRFYIVKQYNQAYKKQFHQSATIQKNITRLNQLFSTEKNKQGIVLHPLRQSQTNSRQLSVERSSPIYVVKSAAAEAFVPVNRNTVNKLQSSKFLNEKQLENTPHKNSLASIPGRSMPDNVSSVIMPLPLVLNKTLDSLASNPGRSMPDNVSSVVMPLPLVLNKTLANNLYKNSLVIQRHDMSLMKYAANINRNIAVSNINTYSDRTLTTGQYKPFKQQSLFDTKGQHASFIDHRNAQYSLKNNATEIRVKDPLTTYVRAKQNDISNTNASYLSETNTYPDQSYIYSGTNTYGRAKKQQQDKQADVTLTDKLTTSNCAQWLEQQVKQQVEQHVKKNLSDLQKDSLNQKRIARDMYQLLNKQLVRERERLGR